MDDSPPPSAEHSATRDEAQVVDLPAVVGPITEVLAFYDALAAHRRPPITQLDAALRSVRALPPIPGRMGRDIALLASGGRGATGDQVADAIERLRNITKFAGAHPV